MATHSAFVRSHPRWSRLSPLIVLCHRLELFCSTTTIITILVYLYLLLSTFFFCLLVICTYMPSSSLMLHISTDGASLISCFVVVVVVIAHTLSSPLSVLCAVAQPFYEMVCAEDVIIYVKNFFLHFLAFLPFPCCFCVSFLLHLVDTIGIYFFIFVSGFTM